MRTIFLSLGIVALLLLHAQAMPVLKTKNLPATRAVIEEIIHADPKAGIPNGVKVRCLGRNSDLTYRVYFDNLPTITAISRKHGRQTITFDQLRIGQELSFYGIATNDTISPDSKHCTVFLP